MGLHVKLCDNKTVTASNCLKLVTNPVSDPGLLNLTTNLGDVENLPLDTMQQETGILCRSGVPP